jgi:ABC-type multidrug transport system fused ATPase/permease subunit
MLAIALLGLVVGFAAATAIGSSNGLLPSVANRLGLGDVDPVSISLWFAVIAATCLILKSVFSFLLTRKTFSFLASRQALVAGRMSMKLLNQPLLRIYNRTSQANAYALTTGVSSAMLGIIAQAVVVASELALLAVLSIGLFLISPWVSLFTYAFFSIVALLIHRIISKRAGELGVTAAAADVESLTAMQNALRSYREAFVTGRRALYVRRFQEMRWVASTVQADLVLMTQVPKYVFDGALVIGGGLLVLSQSISNSIAQGLATIAVFYIASSRIMPSLMRMQGALIDMKHARGMAESTFELARELDYSAEEPSSNLDNYKGDLEAISRGLSQGYGQAAPGISMKNVSITYPGASSPALRGVSVEIPAGSATAIVGATGAGKSTLADLLLGVIDADEGTIHIGDTFPIDAIKNSPGLIGYVPQDIVVIAGTIRENVTLGLPAELVDDTLVWEALSRAAISDFLKEERKGLDTIVGEHGMRLSGGQRQRLGLARALYSRPKLLILDEATSALDASTESEITGALGKMRGETTQVIIAHRLATVQHCDQVIYLENGVLAAKGTFDEVRRSSADFDRQAQLLGL